MLSKLFKRNSKKHEVFPRSFYETEQIITEPDKYRNIKITDQY